MEVICGKCDRKHNIDEKRIKGAAVKFACLQCGHTISVKKSTTSKSPSASPAQGVASSTNKIVGRGAGLSVRTYLLLTMAVGFIVLTGTFTFLALRYVPDIIGNQIELRTQAITSAFSGGIQKPLLLRDYLQVNKEAKRTSQLPGVAYAAVVNQKGIVVGGFFSDLSRFDKDFANIIKLKGFPVDVLNQNKLAAGMERKNARITMGGQTIFDEVTPIPDTGGQVHVGIYVSEVDEAIRKAVFSPLTLSLTVGVLLFGFGIFVMTSQSITKPMESLTDVVNRISLGEMDLAVQPSGPREMRELCSAFDRMHQSVKYIMNRLNK
ncbi:HAMP domain-containing protein [Desulfopila sp. IMCC35006]|uniref:HAMP domain-containing protein n=1 Tax=Desulfopila sp. IMCC35006 TaxID=2569542 RepID=UPI0010AC5377|nr:HAMP domain-containing protein [Desulfopila sp. IMCC35006]TKB25064.1 HAMP domain-containing protein [Desulfopila sp. IMCC35006]